MEKSKRNKIIGLSIGILVVLIIVVSSTYAYWQITKTQKTPNDIVAACLSLDLNDGSAENTGINLDSAWPISDEEGASLTGYTFTVTNNCSEEINYIIGLNRVEEESANYLQDTSIRLQLDDNSAFTYSDLTDVEYADADNTEYTSRVSKQVSVETISANGTNTHTIRVWISDEAPVTEQSKTFLGQVFITGGQGIEAKECFTIANNGHIVNYDESCGLDVKVPKEINSIPVRIISTISFNDNDGEAFNLTNKSTGDDEIAIYYKKTDNIEQINALIKDSFCADSSDPSICTLESEGVHILNNLEEYNAFDWENYNINQTMPIFYNSDDEHFLSCSECRVPSFKIEKLDLSKAKYLSIISNQSFEVASSYDVVINDTCVENTSSGSKYVCKGNLKEVILPQGGILNKILDGAFKNNRIEQLIIPSSVETIDSYSFYQNQITSLTIEDTEEYPSQLTTIGDASFEKNNLTKVVIPSSVQSIYKSFLNNENLTEVIIKNTEDNITLTAAFPSGATITYNPDYTE